jgi:hypothetical protein
MKRLIALTMVLAAVGTALIGSDSCIPNPTRPATWLC